MVVEKCWMIWLSLVDLLQTWEYNDLDHSLESVLLLLSLFFFVAQLVFIAMEYISRIEMP